MPVSEPLSNAGLEVFGSDISTRIIHYVRSRVRGPFSVSDMLEYEPEGKFAGVFIVFSHLQLSYTDFHAAAYKSAQTL